MTKICCAHGCKSNSKNSPSLEFYNLTTARGSLSEWLQAFPFRYRLDILDEVKSGKQSTYNICALHFSQEASEPKVSKEGRIGSTQNKKAFLNTKLKKSPVEIVDVPPDPPLFTPLMVDNNFKMQPINNHVPIFLGGGQPCYRDIGAIGGYVANADVQPNSPLIAPGMVNNNVQMQPIINSHVPAFRGGVQSCNRDNGATGGFVASMNAVQQTQFNKTRFITINGTQLNTNNVANTNAIHSQGINTARFALNAAQTRTDNLMNPVFFMDSPGVMPMVRPSLDTGLGNSSFSEIRIRPKPGEIRAKRPRILTKINPAAIPGFITVNALHPNMQQTNIVGIPGYAANDFVQQSNNIYIPGFVATDNIQPSVGTMGAETINNASHSNDPVMENVEPIKIEDDEIRQMDTSNDDNKNTELKLFDTDQDESDLIKIEFPTDENEEHLVKFEVEESKDDIESYCFFEESGAKRRKSESTDSDFKIVKFEIDTDHDYI